MVTIGFIDTLVASDVVVNVTNDDIPCKDAKDVNDSLSTVASDIKQNQSCSEKECQLW